MTYNEFTTKPSYGMVGFSRIHGGNMRLFGSELTHDTVVRLTIREGEVARDLSQEWYSGGKIIAQVELTEMQFAELLTTMNIGYGVPCTVGYRCDVGYIKHEEEPDKRAMFDKELQQVCSEATSGLDELIKVIDAAPISAKLKKELISQVNHARNSVTSSLPFVEKQFREAMDRTETDAKAAIEGYVMHRVINAGLATIQGQNAPKLIEGETE